jgi:hypothetical protein
MHTRTVLVSALALGLFNSAANAAFHLMQIEEIIGSINGDAAAQAIQLRLRSAGQVFLGSARLRAWDAAGNNPILLLDITSSVTNGNAGDNILLATPKFNQDMAGVTNYASDFVLSNPIPEAYLSGGKVTFEDDSGNVYWSVAFGSYTGTNTGLNSNTSSPSGSFGAPFASALPSAGFQGIRFTGSASASAASNSTDYALTLNPATVRNNQRNSFTVVPEPASLSFLALGAVGLGGMIYARRRR